MAFSTDRAQTSQHMPTTMVHRFCWPIVFAFYRVTALKRAIFLQNLSLNAVCYKQNVFCQIKKENVVFFTISLKIIVWNLEFGLWEKKKIRPSAGPSHSFWVKLIDTTF